MPKPPTTILLSGCTLTRDQPAAARSYLINPGKGSIEDSVSEWRATNGIVSRLNRTRMLRSCRLPEERRCMRCLAELGSKRRARLYQTWSQGFRLEENGQAVPGHRPDLSEACCNQFAVLLPSQSEELAGPTGYAIVTAPATQTTGRASPGVTRTRTIRVCQARDHVPVGWIRRVCMSTVGLPGRVGVNSAGAKRGVQCSCDGDDLSSADDRQARGSNSHQSR